MRLHYSGTADQQRQKRSQKQPERKDELFTKGNNQTTVDF